jgi:hypothetical protein
VANPLLTPSTASATQRTTSRHRVALPARLTWKDPGGAVRFASVVTRDLSDSGAFVECPAGAPLPLFRLVHLQLESGAAGVAHPLAAERVLAAVWRVERADKGAGAQGYALRFLLDPARTAASTAPAFAVPDMAAAC